MQEGTHRPRKFKDPGGSSSSGEALQHVSHRRVIPSPTAWRRDLPLIQFTGDLCQMHILLFGFAILACTSRETPITDRKVTPLPPQVVTPVNPPPAQPKVLKPG
jgi:hypothetical protein